MNSGGSVGKCLRDMISTCELGQTRGSAPTETPVCRGNPLWLPPARRGAHVENLTHRHLLRAYCIAAVVRSLSPAGGTFFKSRTRFTQPFRRTVCPICSGRRAPHSCVRCQVAFIRRQDCTRSGEFGGQILANYPAFSFDKRLECVVYYRCVVRARP